MTRTQQVLRGWFEEVCGGWQSRGSPAAAGGGGGGGTRPNRAGGRSATRRERLDEPPAGASA